MTGPSSSQTPQPLVDLSGLAAGVLWRRRLWGLFALLGVLAGLAVTFVMSPDATAVTKVLIGRADEAAESQDTQMETDVALFNTTATAADATRRLGIDQAHATFAKTFEGEALTSNVLLITAHGPTEEIAVRRAGTLAEVFITKHVGRVRSAAQAQSQALLDRQNELRRDLATASAAESVGVDTDLLQQQAAISAQITTLGQEAQQALAGIPKVEAVTRIVDPPRALRGSILVGAAMNVAVGLILGLTGGIALAAVLCVTRDRPVLRRDIAAQLGVSIVAEIPSLRRRRIRTRGRGARVDARAVQTLVRLMRTNSGRVSLLELGCQRTASALGNAVADALGGVRAVDVGSVNPGATWFELDELGTHTVLIVRAGHASTLWLHTVARRLAEAGITPIGVVLVSPYPWDNTDGALWNSASWTPRLRAAARRPTFKEPEVKVP